MVVALKNTDCRARNGPRRPPRGPPCNRGKHVFFWCPAMIVKIFGGEFQIIMDFWPKNLHFFMLHLCSPLVLGSHGPNSMGSLIPHIMWYFGCLWFSGRRPFGGLAGCFMGPIAQNDPFWGKKMLFTPP